MKRDVVVVGAGPAGSVAAAALARRGRDVLLLDREEFPRDKTCGDGIPPGTVAVLNAIGMQAALRDAGFNRIRGLRLVSPAGRDWRVSIHPRHDDAEFFIAPRIVFDDLIRRHAVACGAEFRRWPVRSLVMEKGRVAGVRVDSDGEERTIEAHLVIGADGATSRVARALIGEKPAVKDRAVAVRAYFEGIETIPRTIEFHWYSRYAPGYAWVFPLGPASANIGVIVRADAFKKRGLPLDELLDEFVHGPGLRGRVSASGELRARAAWQLPYASPRSPRRSFPGALLVGDAARLVDPLTGEGIHNAVISARIAAEVGHEALSRGDTSSASLAAFDARCTEELGTLVRRSHRVQRMVAAHPRAVEALIFMMRAGYGPVTRWLNSVSTDYDIGAAAVVE